MALTVTGPLISLLLADPILCVGTVDGHGNPVPPLLPQGPFLGLTPEEDTAPPSVVVTDTVEKTQWITFRSRIESHKVTATCYAAQGPTPGTDNPAGLLADRVEAVANWSDLGIPNTITMGVQRTLRDISEAKRKARNGEPVFIVKLEWLVAIWVSG